MPLGKRSGSAIRRPSWREGADQASSRLTYSYLQGDGRVGGVRYESWCGVRAQKDGAQVGRSAAPTERSTHPASFSPSLIIRSAVSLISCSSMLVANVFQAAGQGAEQAEQPVWATASRR